MPLAALARLYAQLPAPEQAACSAALQAVETSLAALLDGQAFTPPPTPGDPARWRPLLEAAIDGQRPLEMVYFSPARNLPTRRTIRPAWLLERSGAAYVEAYCDEAGALLTFRLDRILALVQKRE